MTIYTVLLLKKMESTMSELDFIRTRLITLPSSRTSAVYTQHLA